MEEVVSEGCLIGWPSGLILCRSWSVSLSLLEINMSTVCNYSPDSSEFCPLLGVQEGGPVISSWSFSIHNPSLPEKPQRQVLPEISSASVQNSICSLGKRDKGE